MLPDQRSEARQDGSSSYALQWQFTRRFRMQHMHAVYSATQAWLVYAHMPAEAT